MRTVAITGSSGVIGIHLVRALSCQSPSQRVVLIHRRPRKILSLQSENVEIRYVDLLDRKASFEHLQGLRRNTISLVHLAADRLGDDLVSKNCEMTINAIQAIEPDSAIFASSYSVYGSSLKGRVCERVRPRPTSEYAVSKLKSEARFLDLCSKLGIRNAVLRISSVLAPLSDVLTIDQGFYDAVIRLMTEKELPVEIRPGGQTTRDYVDVRDVVRSIISYLKFPNKDYVLNIGSGESRSFANLVEELCLNLGRSRLDCIKLCNIPEESERSFEYDVSQAARFLGLRRRIPNRFSVAWVLRELRRSNVRIEKRGD